MVAAIKPELSPTIQIMNCRDSEPWEQAVLWKRNYEYAALNRVFLGAASSLRIGQMLDRVWPIFQEWEQQLPDGLLLCPGCRLLPSVCIPNIL